MPEIKLDAVGCGSMVVDQFIRTPRIISADEKILLDSGRNGAASEPPVVGGVVLNHLGWARILGLDVGIFGKMGDDRYGEILRGGMNALGTLARHPELTRAYHTFNGHLLFASTLFYVFLVIKWEQPAIALAADEGDCDWRTINGAHVCIGGDGTIQKGPHHLVGKTPKDVEAHGAPRRLRTSAAVAAPPSRGPLCNDVYLRLWSQIGIVVKRPLRLVPLIAC